MPSTLKLVILYDARRNTYTVCDHNLTSQQAEEVVAYWRTGQTSPYPLVVDQRHHHAHTDPQLCLDCRHTVERASGLTPKPQFKRMVIEMVIEKQKGPAPAESGTSRKPWKKKSAVEVVIAQIDRVREDVTKREDELKVARRELQKLEEARKLLESK